MSKGKVECGVHGEGWETFVCCHIAKLGAEGRTAGFNCFPSEDAPFPDAWCDDCEQFLMSHGGEWNEVTQAFADIKLLCSGCYSRFRDLAAANGRLSLH